MRKKISEPNYAYWCKMDEWTFKDAALLIEGLDPLKYRSVKFNLKEIPSLSELKEAYLTFLVFKNFKGVKEHYRTGATPQEILFMAKEKQLFIPEKLHKYFEEQAKLEREKHLSLPTEISSVAENVSNQSDKELSVRERDNLLKAIGLFIHILAGEPTYKKQMFINGRINASQVMQILLDKAGELKINTQGVKSLNRKIKDALALLTEEIE